MKRSLTSRACVALRLIAAAALVVACNSKRSSPDVPSFHTGADSARAVASAHALIGPEAQAALVRGNALFTKKDYGGALTEYRAASTFAPQHAAPFFGMYMVARATNNALLADSALMAIRLRGGAMGAAPHPMAPPKKSGT